MPLYRSNKVATVDRRRPGRFRPNLASVDKVLIIVGSHRTGRRRPGCMTRIVFALKDQADRRPLAEDRAGALQGSG